jgi:hypothetical protein
LPKTLSLGSTTRQPSGAAHRWAAEYSHAGPEFDVLLHILHGDGPLITEVGTLALRPGGLLWLPRLSRREIGAGDVGLTYLTVHPRRPGMTIQPPLQRT